MKNINKKVQETILKFHINQALKDFGIEAEVVKKKVATNYK